MAMNTVTAEIQIMTSTVRGALRHGMVMDQSMDIVIYQYALIERICLLHQLRQPKHGPDIREQPELPQQQPRLKGQLPK